MARPSECDGTGCEWCGDCRICDCAHKYGCEQLGDQLPTMPSHWERVKAWFRAIHQ